VNRYSSSMSGAFSARFGTLSALVLMAALARLLPHPPNFTPVGALALFAGMRFARLRSALGVPLMAMLLSDCLLQLLWGWGFHPQMLFVYGSFGAIAVLGTRLRRTRTWGQIAGASLVASSLFFGVTNFGVWLSSGMYPRSMTGLAACFAAGVPFFCNTLAGDWFYSALIFGAFHLAERRFPILAEQSA